MNTVTPRLFIAATEQDTGKTTMSLGLYAALSERLGRIGYIKPVGQRFTEVDGRRIDDDSLLMEAVFQPRIPIEHMSPIAVEPDFTRRYINESNHDALVKRIRNSFDRACWEKDFTIIEGSGHAGVGAVFDLSNATVARLLLDLAAQAGTTLIIATHDNRLRDITPHQVCLGASVAEGKNR